MTHSTSNRSVQDILSAAEASIDRYQAILDDYTEGQFRQKPSEDAWSIGQMYTHLQDAWFGFFRRKIGKILESEEYAEEKLNERGEFLLKNKKFPVLKVQGPPKSKYDPQPAESKEAAKAKLEKFRASIREVATQLEKSSSAGRRYHGIFGYMNAWEWFELMEIHFRHHWAQKERIDVALGFN